ncbi:HlyC/CorC family transporter [bacterium]|nr:HlyC/CorC family transporter [bacterium]
MFVIISISMIIMGLFLAAFFAGTETAFIVAGRNPMAFSSLDKKKNKRIIWWLSSPDKMLSTTLVGTNIAIIVASSFAANLFIRFLGDRGDLVSVLIISTLSLIFCEIMPKSVARSSPRNSIEKSAFPLYYSFRIFEPIVHLVNYASKIMVNRLERVITPYSPLGWEEIEKISRDGEMDIMGEKQEILLNLFDLKKMTAYDLMEPISVISAIALEARIGELQEYAVANRLSTLPVYQQEKNNILGLVRLSAVIGQNPQKTLQDFIEPAYFTPENISLNTLYREMKSLNHDLAIIVNEYGEISGVLRFEDLIYTFLGKVTPEDRKRVEKQIVKIDDGFLVDGAVEIEVISDLLGTEFEFGRYKTVAGFMIEQKGGFPEIDEILAFKGWKFRVISRDKKRLKRIKIFR